MPKVSVHVPCYNSEKYLHDTIRSVLEQTFIDFELIIINDGSIDQTEKIVRDFDDNRIRYLYQENKGLAATRNIALSLSSGEYIAFLDHDDIWVPEKLEKQVAILDKNPDVALVYSNFYKMFPNGKKSLAHKNAQPSGQVFERFLYNYSVGLLTAIVRKRLLCGLDAFFDESLKIAEDYDLFMMMLFNNNAVYINEPLAFYRLHNNRATINFKDQYVGEYEYAIEKLKMLDPIFSDKYNHALKHLKGKMGYLRAKIAMDKLDSENARLYLSPYKWTGSKFLLLYILTFFPPVVWNKLHNIKNEGFLL